MPKSGRPNLRAAEFLPRYDRHGAFLSFDPNAAAPSVAVKDMIAVAGAPQEAGLPARCGQRAVHDAAAVTRLRHAGYAVSGVTVSDAAGFGATTPSVENPVHPHLSVGGSSGGAAAAVAARLSTVGLGTDTGGSVRIPAAHCDLFAYKASRNAMPRDGVMAMSKTLDTLGLMARDMAALCDAAEVYLGALPRPPDVTLMVDADALSVSDQSISDPLTALGERNGWGQWHPPRPYDVISNAHGMLVCAEAAAVHKQLYIDNPYGFPLEAAAAVRHGLTLRPQNVRSALSVVEDYRRRFEKALGRLQILVAPTLPIPPQPRHATMASFAGGRTPIINAYIRLTLPANVADAPVVVAPTSWGSLQFTGACGTDASLLAAVRAFLSRGSAD